MEAMNSMQQIKAVLFDLDNTLLDRTKTFHGFIATLIQEYLSHAEDAQPIFDRIIHLDQDGYKDKRELFLELIEELPWITKPSQSELLDFYRKHYVTNAILMDQAIEVIEAVGKKYRTGLITNGQTYIQYGKIDHLNIRSLFDVIIVSEEAGVKKPNPKIFEMALEKLELKAEECIYIGDHPINDIEGAASIGMHTIWIQVNQPWREHIVATPLHSIRQLDELLTLL